MLSKGYKYYILRKIFNDSTCSYEEVYHTNNEHEVYKIFDYFTNHFVRYSFVIVTSVICYKPTSWFSTSSSSRL